MTSRRYIALVAVLGLVGIPLLPPEHVHVSESDAEGYHGEFIHRHFEPHHPVEAQRVFDHQDEEPALWLDAKYLPRATTNFSSVDRVVVQQLPLLQPRPLPRWTLTFDHISVHDPPWAASVGLRAPPAFLV